MALTKSLSTTAKRYLQLPFMKNMTTPYKCGPEHLIKSKPEYFLDVNDKDKHKYYTKHQVPLYSPVAFDGMRKAGKLAANCLRHLHEVIEPGITTHDIHAITKEFIERNGGHPSSLGYHGFPGALCTSNNEVACHGVPRKDEVLEEGDIIACDVTCLVDDFYGDTCYTYYVGDHARMDLQTALFLRASQQCRDAAINICTPPQDVNRVGVTIENYLRQFNAKMTQSLGEARYSDTYEVLKEFTGHGIGTAIHEKLEVLHFATTGQGVILTEGVIFTVEPIVLLNPPKHTRSDGRRSYLDETDKWTVRVADVLSAQFEHCVGMTKDGPEIFTFPDDPYPDVWNTVLRDTFGIKLP